jgi:lysophospholipase L1-like esterase
MKLLATAAGRGILVLLIGLLLAALLQAEGLRKQAETQPAGFQRDVALQVTRPLLRFSRALHLTTPRHDLQVAIGRGNEDEIDSQVHLTLPPPAGPLPRHTGTPTPLGGRHTGTHTPLKPRFSVARPLRVWVAGDSLAQIPGQALERATNPALKVVGVESRLSTGLARPDLYNWFTRIQQAPEELVPKVAVFSFGADDAHDFMTGVPTGKSVGPIGTRSWSAEYRRRVDGVIRELNAEGIYVVLLGLPIPDGPGFKKTFPIVNRILESVATAHRKTATYIDTWHLLDDAHGRYAPYLRVHGKLTLMRLPDGVHYTAAAGDLIAQQVLKQLSRVYRFG